MRLSGKDFGQLPGDQGARPIFPANSAQAWMDNQRVLHGAQIGAERQFLEHAADTEGVSLGRVIGPVDCLPLDRNVP